MQTYAKRRGSQPAQSGDAARPGTPAQRVEAPRPPAPGGLGHDFSRVRAQAKLAVDAPGDAFEQEADRVAERVTGVPEPRLPDHEQRPLDIQRVPPDGGERTGAPPAVHEVLRAPGRPLDDATRAFMEPRFGQDFSQVRVHADARAADSARALDALAYTVGRDVVLGAGPESIRSGEGRKLLAHELTHVVQQGFTARLVQRQPKPKKKKATTNPKLVFEQIKKRDPELAELITPQSIDFNSPKNPPAIKAGPMQGGEEHVWKVRVLAQQGFAGSMISRGADTRTKVRGGTQVTHFLELVWALPIAIDKDFLQQTGDEDQAFTLTAAVSLYHELLHARIMMEREPSWTSQHSRVFQEFTAILQIANSPAVAKERQALKQEIGVMAKGGGQATTAADVQREADKYYEFLIHEKYDADSVAKAFGKPFPNSLIAKNYSNVVALRLGLGDKTFQVLKDKLAAAAEKLFDKLDQAAKAGTPQTPAAPPTGTAPQQPKK